MVSVRKLEHTKKQEAPVIARIHILGSDRLDDLIALENDLQREIELCGRISRISPRATNTLGSISNSLEVLLVPGGASALAYTIVAFIKSRNYKISVRITTSAGDEYEVNADRLRNGSAEDVKKIIDAIEKTSQHEETEKE